MSLYDRLDFQRGIVDQDINKRFLVLYTASSKDANSVIFDRNNYKKEFIIESKTYWFATDDFEEANYLCSFLNCSYTNKLIKAFQSRGLFGVRDVHKKILEIPLPQYNKRIELHNELALLGKICTSKTIQQFGNKTNMDLSPSELGITRLSIRENLKSEIKEMDKIVKSLVE
jgi:hypothetical protein